MWRQITIKNNNGGALTYFYSNNNHTDANGFFPFKIDHHMVNAVDPVSVHPST